MSSHEQKEQRRKQMKKRHKNVGPTTFFRSSLWVSLTRNANQNKKNQHRLVLTALSSCQWNKQYHNPARRREKNVCHRSKMKMIFLLFFFFTDAYVLAEKSDEKQSRGEERRGEKIKEKTRFFFIQLIDYFFIARIRLRTGIECGEQERKWTERKKPYA